MDKVAISASFGGYLRPILLAAITRGLGTLSGILAARGFPELPSDTSAAASVLAVFVAVAMWLWGPIKSYFEHRLKVEAADPDSRTTLVLK